MRPAHGKVHKSGQEMAREFCGLEARACPKGLE